MSLLDSEAWVAYALSLLDTHRYGLQMLSRESKARQLEDALVASLAAEDLPGLFACAEGRDPVASLGAVSLLSRLVLCADLRIAHAAADVTRTLRAVTEGAYPERLEGRLALLGWLEAAPREAGLFLRRHAIEDILPLEAEVRFPVAGGGELVLDRGRHVLRLNLLDLPPPALDDATSLLMRVEIADSSGRVFRAHVPFHSRWFIEMLPRGLPTSPGEGSVVLSQLGCHLDERRWWPVIELQGGEATARAYWGKYLSIGVTVRKGRARGSIVLDVAAHHYGGAVGGRDMPAVAVEGHLIARYLLARHTWMGGTRFHLTDEIDEPQPGVRVADGGSDGEEAQPLSSILQRIVSDSIGTGRPFSLYAGWLATIRPRVAEALLQAVEPAGLPGYGDSDLCYALDYLVRGFGSAAALGRLRELSAGAGAASASAYMVLARHGEKDPSRVERELEKWRQTRSRDSALWLERFALQELRIGGATVESVRDQVKALLGPPSREAESTLTYDTSDDSQMHLYVRVASYGPGSFHAYLRSGTAEPPFAFSRTEPPPPVTRAAFALGADALFATDGGRHLRIDRSQVTATVRLEGDPPFEIRAETSTLRLALYLSDEQGRVFQASRPLTASLLLDAWRASDVGSRCRPDEFNWVYAPPSTQPVLDAVKIFWPEARLVVRGLGFDAQGKVTNWEPQLLDLTGLETVAVLHQGAETLTTVLQLGDGPDGLCGFLTARPLATMVLMPSLLGARADTLQPAVFVDTGRIEAPTPGVRLEP